MPSSNFTKYALFNIVPSKPSTSLNLTQYILLLSITLIWMLTIFYFYDRLMSFLWRIIIIKHFGLKPPISFSFASIRFNLFLQAIYIRDLHIRLGGEEWFKCTSLEVKLNRLKPRLFSHMITKKMFYLRFHECKALLDTKLFDLVELLSLKSCLFDLTDLSILLYNARTLQAFDFEFDRIISVFAEQNDQDIEAVQLSSNDAIFQLFIKSSKCRIYYFEEFLKRCQNMNEIARCFELKLKVSLFKSAREFKIGEDQICQVSKSIDIICRRADIDFFTDRFISYLQDCLLPQGSILFKFQINDLYSDFYCNRELIFRSKSSLLGKACNSDLINIKFSNSSVRFICCKDNSFECDLIEFSSTKRLDNLSILVNFRERSIFRVKNLILFAHIFKIESTKFNLNPDVIVYLNGVMIQDLNESILTSDRISFKLRNQTDDSKKSLLLIDQPKLSDKNRSIEISNERIVVEITDSKADTKWQIMTSPIRVGRYKENKSNISDLSPVTSTTESSSDSYLYISPYASEDSILGNIFENEDEPINNDLADMNSLYLSVVQIRGELLKNTNGGIYSRRFEMIFGDTIGSVGAETLVRLSAPLNEIYCLINAELEKFEIILQPKNDYYTSFKLISSLAHINIVNNSSLFNFIVSPFDYAVCDFHEMGLLPELSLNLFVCLGGGGAESSPSSKYTDLLDCGSFCVRYIILKRVKPRDLSRLESLRKVDETRRLAFLWAQDQDTCLCVDKKEIFGHESTKEDREFYIKPCLYFNESFGKSLLEKNELSFYSYRKFFAEIKAPKISDRLLVVSCLERSNESREKRKFQPSEIQVYENELNQFIREKSTKSSLYEYEKYKESLETTSNKKPNESDKKPLEVSHMTPPYFSGEFRLYIRYLPIVKNIPKCDLDSAKWSPISTENRSIQVDYFIGSRLHSDFMIQQKSRRKKSIFEALRKYSTNRKDSSSLDSQNHYKFSVDQFRPARKMSRKASELDGKRLRVGEIYIESVFDGKEEESEDDIKKESIVVEYPNLTNDDGKKKDFFLFITLLTIRKSEIWHLLDVFELSENESINRFHLKFTSKNDPTEFQSLICINKFSILNSDQISQLEAKNVMIHSDAENFPVNKLLAVEELSLDLDSYFDLRIIEQFLGKFRLNNDCFIRTQIKRVIFSDEIVFPDLKVDMLYSKSDCYFEMRSITTNIQFESEKSMFIKFIGFIRYIFALVSKRLQSDCSYNVDFKLSNLRGLVRFSEFAADLDLKELNFQASNRFTVKNSRVKLTSLLRVGLDELANIEIEIKKMCLDTEIKMLVKEGRQRKKLFVNMMLPMFLDTECCQQDDGFRIRQAFLSIANNEQFNYSLLVELNSIRVAVERTMTSIRIQCDLVRAVQSSQLDLFDFRIETPLLEELSVFFGTKRLIYTYFPEKLTTSENWLYMNLFDFEIDYTTKNEEDEDLIEEFRVKFKETTNDQNELRVLDENGEDNLSPKRSMCLWLGSNDPRPHPTTNDEQMLKTWLDYACMQEKNTSIAYSIQPLAKFASTNILLTFEYGGIDERVYWRYRIDSELDEKETMSFINRDLAQTLWKRLIIDKQQRDISEKYVLSVLDSKSVSKFGSLMSWKIGAAQKLSKSDFGFFESQKLGGLLKERIFLLLFLSRFRSMFAFVFNKD